LSTGNAIKARAWVHQVKTSKRALTSGTSLSTICRRISIHWVKVSLGRMSRGRWFCQTHNNASFNIDIARFYSTVDMLSTPHIQVEREETS
jgi:hypothetical protein